MQQVYLLLLFNPLPRLVLLPVPLPSILTPFPLFLLLLLLLPLFLLLLLLLPPPPPPPPHPPTSTYSLSLFLQLSSVFPSCAGNDATVRKQYPVTAAPTLDGYELHYRGCVRFSIRLGSPCPLRHD